MKLNQMEGDHIIKRIFPSLILLTLGFLGFYYFFNYGNNQQNNQSRVISVYATKESCEEANSKECIFPVCGPIPKGSNFKDVCKVDFNQGWITVDNYVLYSDRLSTVFSSKEVCEQATNKVCILKDCSSKTYDEVCEGDYIIGWRTNKSGTF